MKIYESFFRTFCRNPDEEMNHLLKADKKSFRKGIQYWYNGKDNPSMHILLYSYLGKYKQNHKITFSEFLNFCQEMTLSKYH